MRYRRGHNANDAFPEIVRALRLWPCDEMILDGEIVVLDAQSKPQFQSLQKRFMLRRPNDIEQATVTNPVTYMVFDILALNGYDLRTLSLEQRKSILKQLVPAYGPIRYVDDFPEHGKQIFAQVKKLHFEGLVAKRLDSPYVSGRSNHWLKLRIEKSDDFVIVGYTTDLGALLLATYDQYGELHYTGRVGTGFTQKMRRDLLKLFTEQIEPACKDIPQARDNHYVAPNTVCEVRFKERTRDHLLRQPVFLRLRPDKKPTECMMYQTAAEPAAVQQEFTNLEKIFWPKEGYTKGDLIAYYQAIGKWILPYLKDRPLVLTRYPDGIAGKSFFQKDAPKWAPDWIRTVTIESSEERPIRYFVCNDLQTLLFLINLGTIPLHIYASRLQSLEQPDFCILDLDPKKAPFAHVIKVAQAIHRLCDKVGLPTYVKTSGSTGLHVLIPLAGQCTFDQTRTLAEIIAQAVVREFPDIATLMRNPAKREDKVYIDCGQNGRGKLIAAPFCVRPVEHAQVSMPLEWHEVTSKLNLQQFTIKTAVSRMKRKKDPLLDVLKKAPNLDKVLRRLATLIQ
jgi:bifunctional non-homologous end joining protein LigD